MNYMTHGAAYLAAATSPYQQYGGPPSTHPYHQQPYNYYNLTSPSSASHQLMPTTNSTCSLSPNCTASKISHAQEGPNCSNSPSLPENFSSARLLKKEHRLPLFSNPLSEFGRLIETDGPHGIPHQYSGWSGTSSSNNSLGSSSSVGDNQSESSTSSELLIVDGSSIAPANKHQSVGCTKDTGENRIKGGVSDSCTIDRITKDDSIIGTKSTIDNKATSFNNTTATSKASGRGKVSKLTTTHGGSSSNSNIVENFPFFDPRSLYHRQNLRASLVPYQQHRSSPVSSKGVKTGKLSFHSY